MKRIKRERDAFINLFFSGRISPVVKPICHGLAVSASTAALFIYAAKNVIGGCTARCVDRILGCCAWSGHGVILMLSVFAFLFLASFISTKIAKRETFRTSGVVNAAVLIAILLFGITTTFPTGYLAVLAAGSFITIFAGYRFALRQI